MHEIKLGKHSIGNGHPPFIVAEMSANHNGSLEQALRLVDAASAAGAHAVKLQTYTADTMTLDINEREFVITDEKSLWRGRSLYNLYQEAATPWEWHAPIFQRCKELDIIPFSTPFDATAVDFLESLNVPCYKIASLEINDIPLIRKVAATRKPLFISTGGATYDEIQEAVGVARSMGCHKIVLLKCTVAYPAPADKMNLRTLPHLADSFGVLVGLSDHTFGIGASIASIPLGACVIEKHFTMSREEEGVDAAFSLEPHELKSLVVESRRAWEALGEICYGPTDAEKSTLEFRRSLYFIQDLPKGTKLLPEHIKSIRPGKGMHPREYERILESKLKNDVKRGSPISEHDLELD